MSDFVNKNFKKLKLEFWKECHLAALKGGSTWQTAIDCAEWSVVRWEERWGKSLMEEIAELEIEMSK